MITKTLLLGSKSPRRKELLEKVGLKPIVKTIDVEEVYPDDLPIQEIASFLAKLKANAYLHLLSENELILTADTIVIYKDEILHKPKSREEAIETLLKLSGQSHLVNTAFCLQSKNKSILKSCITEVYFKNISIEQIEYYIDNYKPYDKAGSYGIQEWIGMIAVEKLNGSYYNVVGLPIAEVYQTLLNF